MVVLLDHALHGLQDMASLDPALSGAVSSLSEHPWLMIHLPRQYRTRYDRRFVQRFLACLMTVAYKFAQGPWHSLSCAGEELVAYAFVEDARSNFKLNSHPNQDDVFAEPEDTIFEDMELRVPL